ARPPDGLDLRRRQDQSAHPAPRGRPRTPGGQPRRGRLRVRRGGRPRDRVLGVGARRAAERGGRRVVGRLSSGAEARVTGLLGGPAVVCVNGGQGAEVPGTWSATLEWLVRRLAPALPGLAFVEVCYRVKSWKRLGECIEDCRAAVDLAHAPRVALVGFSM